MQYRKHMYMFAMTLMVGGICIGCGKKQTPIETEPKNQLQIIAATEATEGLAEIKVTETATATETNKEIDTPVDEIPQETEKETMKNNPEDTKNKGPKPSKPFDKDEQNPGHVEKPDPGIKKKYLYAQKNTKMLKTPEMAGEMITLIKAAEKVEVLDETTDWYYLTYENKNGFALKRDFGKTKPEIKEEEKDEDKDEKHEHNFVRIKVVRATCTSEGYEIYKCACGETKKEILDKTPHYWDEWKVIKKPTYKEEGTKLRKCFGCGKQEKESIPKLECEHKYKETVIQPTCTKGGYTEHICEICGDKYIDKETAPLKHQYKEINKKEATCTEDGFIEYKCQNNGCNDSYKDTIKKLGHDMGEWKITTPATPEKDGVETRQCNRCPYSETRPVKSKHVHDMQYVETVDPTCDKEGYKLYKCSGCDYTEKREPTPKKEHVYEKQNTIAPTCIDKGYTIYKCKNCFKEEKRDFVDAMGHQYGDWIVDIEATETTPGSKHRVCKIENCKAEETVEIPIVHQHSYQDEIIPPTCTEQGYTLHKCKCGHSYKDNYTEATGHTMSTDGEVIKEATTESSGIKRFKCLNPGCHYYEDKEIPMLIPSETENNNATDPTKQEDETQETSA